jgi:hypothetical protein
MVKIKYHLLKMSNIIGVQMSFPFKKHVSKVITNKWNKLFTCKMYKTLGQPAEPLQYIHINIHSSVLKTFKFSINYECIINLKLPYIKFTKAFIIYNSVFS